MTKFFTALLLLNTFIGSAQIQSSEISSLNDLQFYIRNNKPSYNIAEGSRYLNDDFLPARINGIQKTQLVRFNVPDNIVEVKNSNNEIMALSFTEGYTISIQDGTSRVYETHSFMNSEDKKASTFFEKLYEEGKFKLFLKENIKFVPAKPAKSGYEPAKPAQFSRENDTFYFTGFGSYDSKVLIALPKKRKNFVRLFGEHSGAIEKKIKSDKLYLKNAENLVRLFKSYFELK